MMAIGEEPFMVMAFTADPPEAYRPLEVWPQHVTVMPWMQGRRLQAVTRIGDAVQNLAPINVSIADNTRLGQNHNVEAWLLAPNLALASLHEIVYQAATKVDTKVLDDRHTGDGYLPHITKKSNQPMRTIGETLTLAQLAIVGRHNDRKMVFKNIELCDNDSTKR